MADTGLLHKVSSVMVDATNIVVCAGSAALMGWIGKDLIKSKLEDRKAAKSDPK